MADPYISLTYSQKRSFPISLSHAHQLCSCTTECNMRVNLVYNKYSLVLGITAFLSDI